MSKPGRIIQKQLKRSAKDISDEWKRIPEPVRNGVTAAAAIAAVAVTAGGAAPAVGAAGAGAGAAGTAGAGTAAAIGGTGIGVGTGTLAASGAAAAGGAGAAAGGAGFLGSLASGAKAIGGGLSAAGSALNSVNPALLAVGGQALAGAMAPEPETQVDVLREQERIRNARQAPNIDTVTGPTGGYLGAPAGVTTTPQPIRPQPQATQTHVPNIPMAPDVGHWDAEKLRWVTTGARG